MQTMMSKDYGYAFFTIPNTKMNYSHLFHADKGCFVSFPEGLYAKKYNAKGRIKAASKVEPSR